MTWRRDPAVVWDDDGTHIWAVHPTVGEVASLTDTAAVVWELLGDRAFAAVVDRLAEASGESRTVIRRDITGYLEQLEELGLVRRD